MKNFYLPISIIIGALIVGGAAVYIKKPQKTPEDSKEKESTEITVTEKDHIKGISSAPVTIVEFSDFQCPYCSSFHPVLQQILDNHSTNVRWVYKHFPLDQKHFQARPAAEASECADEQGKFWEFAAGLFENQSRLAPGFYKELAQNLGLNVNQFENCFSQRKYKDKVEADYQEGIRAGVRGTPASFINGEMVSGAVPYETLKAAVERALSKVE